MLTFLSRTIAKLPYAPILMAAFLLAPTSGFSTPPMPSERWAPLATYDGHQPAPVSSIRWEFEKERGMSPSELINRWAHLIKEASVRFGMSEDWIKAVIRMESGGRTVLDDKRPTTSSAGAMGIMQLMPATYREMRQQNGLGPDPYNPHDNVLAGTAYLRWLYDRYGYPRMFAAYNAGPGALEAQLAGARQLPDETRAYVRGIARILGTKSTPSRSASNGSQTSKPIVRLTRPDGSPIWVDAAGVTSIRAPLPDDYAGNVRTVLALGSARQGVREDLATVASLLKRREASASVRREIDRAAATKSSGNTAGKQKVSDRKFRKA